MKELRVNLQVTNCISPLCLVNMLACVFLKELRVNQAIDVMVKHVENLKKVYEKEHAELLEARYCVELPAVH